MPGYCYYNEVIYHVTCVNLFILCHVTGDPKNNFTFYWTPDYITIEQVTTVYANFTARKSTTLRGIDQR